MQTRPEEWMVAGESNLKSDIQSEATCKIIEEIERLVAPRRLRKEALSTAFEESLLEMGEKSLFIHPEEMQPHLIGLTLWKLFARGAAFWVNPQTDAGNPVPLNLLAAAYSLWKSSLNLAIRNGMDAAIAAEILVRVTHDTADLISRNEKDSRTKCIHHMHRYLCTAYTNSINRLAAKRNSREVDSFDAAEWIARRELSDQGAAWEAADNEILCRELLNAMQPKGRSVAIARYILGYSWPEIAKSLGTSVNAAQKALSSGIRNILEIYGQEFSRIGSKRAKSTNVRRLKKRKSELRRKMLNEDAHR